MVAGKWFFASVSSPVFAEIAELRAAIIALLTSKRFLTRMDSFVDVEMSELRAAIIALLAGKRLVARQPMGQLMPTKMSTVRATEFAFVTAVLYHLAIFGGMG